MIEPAAYHVRHIQGAGRGRVIERYDPIIEILEFGIQRDR
jgi:hypothetical protein